jgi:hypothetical protein
MAPAPPEAANQLLMAVNSWERPILVPPSAIGLAAVLDGENLDGVAANRKSERGNRRRASETLAGRYPEDV